MNQMITLYLLVEHCYQLYDRSKCDCHEECQLVPSDNANNDNRLPVIIINHIIDYWRTVPLNDAHYFPNDNVNPFDGFISLLSAGQSDYDDNENNNDYIHNNLTSLEDITEDDIPDGNCDHPFIID